MIFLKSFSFVPFVANPSLSLPPPSCPGKPPGVRPPSPSHVPTLSARPAKRGSEGEGSAGRRKRFLLRYFFVPYVPFVVNLSPSLPHPSCPREDHRGQATFSQLMLGEGNDFSNRFSFVPFVAILLLFIFLFQAVPVIQDM